MRILTIKLRIILLAVLAAFLVIGFSGCYMEDDMIAAETPNAKQPSFMVDGVLYYTTGTRVIIEADENDHLGTITSVVSIDRWPTANDQANIPYEGSPYVAYEDGMALWMEDQWIYFEPI